MMDIIALNLSPPYDNKTLTPFEELHAFISPVNGIPMTDDAGKEMIERKWLSNKKQKMEMKNTTPTTKTSISEDGHNQTQEERENPKVISGSRRKRISQGSGVEISKINRLLKQFRMMSDMMKKISKGKKIPSGTMPDEILNQLK